MKRSLLALLLALTVASCTERKPPAAPSRDLTYEDVVFGAALAEIRGHHFVGLQLHRDGNAAAALPHAGHPILEILPTVEDHIRRRQPGTFDALKRSLEEVRKAIEARQPAGDVAKAVAAATAAIGGAEDAVLGSLRAAPVYTGSVVAAVLSAAALEYGEAVAGGTVRQPVEYQDAYGFARVAEQLYAGIRPEVMRVGAIEGRAIDAAFDRLERIMPLPTPPVRPARFEDVRTEAVLIATRIQETVGAILAPPRTPADVVGRIRMLLDEMVAAYDRGDLAEVSKLASEAYLQNYELIEIDVISAAEHVNEELEPILSTRLEDLMTRRAPRNDVLRLVVRAKALLAEALAALDTSPSP